MHSHLMAFAPEESKQTGKVIDVEAYNQTLKSKINQVRARAYGVDISETDKYPEIETMDQSKLREVIRRERRVELALEGLRWYDIRRWKTAEIVRNEPVSGVQGSILERNFEASRDYYWPIPQREIDLIGADVLTQNNGY